MPRDDPIVEEERKAHSAYDLIRMRLDRLEKNIHKPAPIPARRAELKAPRPPSEFVRNVVGSSAAAGSAEFHIYRNNRKKEQNRLDYITKVAEKEELDEEFRNKRDSVQQAEAEKTAKKRAKRLRKKGRDRLRKKAKLGKDGAEESSNDESDDSNSVDNQSKNN